MKFNILHLIAILLSVFGFLAYPKELIIAASKGLLICGEVIIPSLFPFTVFSVMLFNSKASSIIKSCCERFSLKIFGLNGNSFFIMIMSFIGGFPVGAKLINEAVLNKSISADTAKRMLYYCINPGPAFVIIAIGQGLFGKPSVGYVIYASNIIASLLICLIFSKKEKFNAEKHIKNFEANIPFTDLFVKSVYDSCTAIIGICGFVILFSAVIGVINAISDSISVTYFTALLEISNGIIIFKDNIFLLSFITGFSGICVHLQILSLTKDFSVKYLHLFIFKLLSGLLSVTFTYFLLKILKISVTTVSAANDIFFISKTKSLTLSAALIFMSIVLLVTIKQNFVEKSRKI